MSETPAQKIQPIAETASHAGSLVRPLASRNFRLLWVGESVSLFGDQFYLVALPWLTLQITGSGLALGTVLMAAAIPRVLFMLVGGALADHFSPRALMLASNAARALLAGALAVLVLANSVTLWLLYLFALAFGLADAFFQPAMLAIVPSLVGGEDLAPSNALLQITGQISEVAGPALAGLVITFGAIWVAFAIDAATFVVTALALLLIRERRRAGISEAPAAVATPERQPNLAGEMLAGLRAIWREPPMRTFLLLIACTNLFLIGPLTAGLPALALLRFQNSPTAFGIMLTAFGAGALVGTLLAGAARPPRRLGPALLSTSVALGAGLVLLGAVPTLLAALGVIAAIGGGVSFINIHILAWLQRRTPPELLGRVMSVVMLAVVGLDPLSRAAAGIAIDFHLAAMFGAAGLLLTLFALLAMLSRSAREIG